MKQKWKLIWARKYAPYLGSAYFKAFTTRRGYNQLQNKLFVPEGKLNAYYVRVEEWNRLVKKITGDLLKCDLKKFGRWYEYQFVNLERWTKKFILQPVQELDNRRLAALLRECTKRLEQSGEVQFLSFVVAGGPGEAVEKIFGNDANNLAAISTPYRATRLMRARLELLRLVAERHDMASRLQLYLEKYVWLPIYDIADDSLTMRALQSEIRNIKDANAEIATYRRTRRENLTKYKKLIRTINDQRLKKTIEIVHLFSYLKEMRDDYRRHVYWLLKPFFREIADRTGLTFEDVNYLLVYELEALLLGKKGKYGAEARKRRSVYSLVLDNGKIKIFAADKRSNYFTEDVDKQQQLTGLSANVGKVAGTVRIIYHRSDFEKFKPGEILVTPMTHPEFMPIMKQAAAIVTNEGGITCHAAVVARELGKPCIIGTKIATHIFKDGNRVEVDADKGIVKKLK